MMIKMTLHENFDLEFELTNPGSNNLNEFNESAICYANIHSQALKMNSELNDIIYYDHVPDKCTIFCCAIKRF